MFIDLSKFKDVGYKTRYFVTQYNDMYYRITVSKYCRNPGVDIEKNKELTILGMPVTCDIVANEFNKLECDRVSLSRSRRRIRDYCFSNPFTYFATITINSKNGDRFSLQQCQDLLKKKLKKLKRQNKDFMYLFITEKHKNGAFHFHGLINDIDFYTNSNGYLSNKVFDEMGFNSFSKIRDFNKTCNYIMKYITKDCIRNDKNQIFIFSKNLKKPVRYEVKDLNFDYIPTNKFENDFVIQYDCYNNSDKIGLK